MPIDEARIKLDRAPEHIREFEGEFRTFLDGNPYTIRLKRHLEESHYIARIEINSQPSERWGLMIGDAIHNLRSSLDYLVCQLSLDRGATLSREMEFPIFETPPRGDAFSKRVKHLPAGAVKVIRSMQPYDGGKSVFGHKLWVISALDNADKHRRLSVVTYGLGLRFQGKGGTLSLPPFWGSLYDGQEIEFSVRSAVVPPLSAGQEFTIKVRDMGDAEMDAQAQCFIGVAFDNFGQLRFLELYPKNNLAGLFHYVRRRAFAELEPFFEVESKPSTDMG